MKKLFVCITGLLLFANVGCGSSNDNTGSMVPSDSEVELGEMVQNPREVLEQQFDPYIQDIVESFAIPGFAIGIVKDNEILYAKAFGLRNVDSQEAATTHSVFHMASISKVFVGTAIMQLVEQGKIDLNTPLVEYLPYFTLADERYKQITIRQLLNHTSGLGDTLDFEYDNPQYGEGALEEYVRSLAHDTLRSDPGETYAYSNIAYNILGDVIAKVSDKPFETYMQEHIFTPLGMDNSTFYAPDVPENLATIGHIFGLTAIVDDVYPYNRIHAPSSTLQSNLVDMCRWLMVNLNKGELEGQRILDPASYEQLWTPTVSADTFEIGLSWYLGAYKGLSIVEHDGWDFCFSTEHILVPEESLGIVIMANTGSFTGKRDIAYAVIDILHGLEAVAPLPALHVALGKTIAEKDIETAVNLFMETTENNFNEYTYSPTDIDSIGAYLLKQNRPEDAVKIFTINARILEASNDQLYAATAYYRVAEGYWAAKQQDNAKEHLEKALTFETDNNKFITYVDFCSSLQLLQEMLKLLPDNSKAVELLKLLETVYK